MKFAVQFLVVAAFVGSAAATAEATTEAVLQQYTEENNAPLKLPTVPKVQNAGSDGMPSLPAVENMLDSFVSVRHNLNSEASSFAKHLQAMEQDSQAKIADQRGVYESKLKEQEKSNQVVVKENAKLAREIMQIHSENNELTASIKKSNALIQFRRGELLQFEKAFSQMQKYAQTTLDSTDIRKEVAFLGTASKDSSVSSAAASKPSSSAVLDEHAEVNGDVEGMVLQGQAEEGTTFMGLSFMDMSPRKKKHKLHTSKRLRSRLSRGDQNLAQEHSVKKKRKHKKSEEEDKDDREEHEEQAVVHKEELKEERTERKEERQEEQQNEQEEQSTEHEEHHALAQQAQKQPEHEQESKDLAEQKEEGQLEVYGAFPHVDVLSEKPQDSNDDDEAIITALTTDVKKLRESNRVSQMKLKELFAKSFQAGEERHKALLAQQKVMKTSFQGMKTYGDKLKATLSHVRTTLGTLESAVKHEGAQFGNLEQAAVAPAKDVQQALDTVARTSASVQDP